MFKKCLCSTGSTGKRRKLSYLLTLSYYLHLQWLELGFPAYNENSHFCLSTPHLSGHQTTQWAFPIGTIHSHFKLNMVKTKFIIFIFTIYTLRLQFFAPMFSNSVCLSSPIRESLPAPLQVHEFYGLIISRLQTFLFNPVVTILVVVTAIYNLELLQ